jgi:hypothetical protein
MLVTIEPSNFARLMSLPQTQRHDLLEFLGATAMPMTQADTLLHLVSRRTPPPVDRRLT